MTPTNIYQGLSFNPIDGNQYLASYDDYMEGDRCVGSIYEALNPGEIIRLREGTFILDGDLDPINPNPDEHPRESALRDYV